MLECPINILKINGDNTCSQWGAYYSISVYKLLQDVWQYLRSLEFFLETVKIYKTKFAIKVLSHSEIVQVISLVYL